MLKDVPSVTWQCTDTHGLNLRIVFWSGGVDSTLLAYKVLTETTDDILLHHVNLLNSDNRNHCELAAIRNIMPLLMQLRPYVYSESTLDLTCISGTSSDEDIMFFLGGRIAMAYPYYKKVIFSDGSISEDYDGSMVERESLRGTQEDYFKVVSWSAKNAHLELPLREMTKKEVWEALPDNIKYFTWSCRFPTRTNSPCGECVACKKRKLIDAYYP